LAYCFNTTGPIKPAGSNLVSLFFGGLVGHVCFLLFRRELSKISWFRQVLGTLTSIVFSPLGRTKVYISKEETVYFESENGADVQVDEILNKGVEGMRYIKTNKNGYAN